MPPRTMFEDMPRGRRRQVLSDEGRARRTGKWPPWERIDMPHGVPATAGWGAQVRAAHRNWVFSVLERPLFGPAGLIGVHLGVTSLSKIRPTWHEMQRIKNELAGEAATGVEVYPPQSEVVDDADMFHLWVTQAPSPFSLPR